MVNRHEPVTIQSIVFLFFFNIFAPYTLACGELAFVVFVPDSYIAVASGYWWWLWGFQD